MAKICRKTWENCSRLQQLEGEVPNGRPWLCATDIGQDWCRWLRWLMERHCKPEKSEHEKKFSGEWFLRVCLLFRLISILLSTWLESSLVHIGTFNYVCFEWQSHFLSPLVLPKTNFPLLFPYSMFVGIFFIIYNAGTKKSSTRLTL